MGAFCFFLCLDVDRIVSASFWTIRTNIHDQHLR
jgi:hypothetical protein